MDVDLSKFLDRVDHDLLMNGPRRFITDKRLLKLIGRYLRAGVMIEGKRHPTSEGVPQGGPLSPLLANVLLDDLDKRLESQQLRFARYGAMLEPGVRDWLKKVAYPTEIGFAKLMNSRGGTPP